MPMKISLDYDKTFTEDPVLWSAFAVSAMKRGHVVYCVSFRHEFQMDEPKATIGKVIGVQNCIGTNGQPKRSAMQALGVQIDVWIDDMPELICDDLVINWNHDPKHPR